MSEPRTAAGRALHRDFTDMGMPANASAILTIEQEAAALDVERLARAVRKVDGDAAAGIYDADGLMEAEYAAAIAREYEKLRTPEGDDPACCHPFASKRPDGPRWCDLCSAIIDIEPEAEG